MRWLRGEVAYTMEAPERLLPHLAWLLQNLPSLGGVEEAVLREAGSLGTDHEAKLWPIAPQRPGASRGTGMVTPQRPYDHNESL